MRICWPAIVVVAALGCQKAPAKAMVPLAEVPEVALTNAKAELPDVKFETARLITVEGQPAYEIRGKNAKGKIREVEVRPDGVVIEVE